MPMARCLKFKKICNFVSMFLSLYKMKNVKEKVLKQILNELRRMDDAILRFLSLESLPEPIACKPGCDYCCFNLPMITPPEALVIGHHLDQTFSDRQKQTINKKIQEIIKKIAGKRADEIYMMRHELPCIFLKDSMCIIYSVRPAVCRACCSTLISHCKMIFETRDHRARLRSYPQLRAIFEAVHHRFIKFCREMGCQSDTLKLSEAVEDYFRHPNPIDAWLHGEILFHFSYS
jgi:Fe-S-cluster containining protein